MLLLTRQIRLLSMLLATIASPVYGNMCCQGAYLTMPIMNGTCPLAPLDSVPYNIHKECAGLCCSTRIEIRPSNQTSDGYFAVACVAGLSEWEHGIQDIRNIFSKNNILEQFSKLYRLLTLKTSLHEARLKKVKQIFFLYFLKYHD